MRSQTVDLRTLLDGSHWAFLCFTPERRGRLKAMFMEFVGACYGLSVAAAHFPAGVLWNGEPCDAFFVPKKGLDPDTLVAGLRKHLGYENPDPGSNVFTLGVTPEDDAALDRVGLFGKG
jgi:hypothetical protein